MTSSVFVIVPRQVRQHGFEVEELLESIDRDVLPEAKKLANDLYKVQSVFRDNQKRRGSRQGVWVPRGPAP